MDDQRIEEIAKRLVATLRDDLDVDEYGELDRRASLPIAVAALREALSSQEEALAAFRRNDAVIRAEHGWKRDGRELPELVEEALRSLREELRVSYEVGADYTLSAKTARERAESADGELLRLREESRLLAMDAWDAAIDASLGSDDVAAARARYLDRLASPLQEKGVVDAILFR